MKTSNKVLGIGFGAILLLGIVVVGICCAHARRVAPQLSNIAGQIDVRSIRVVKLVETSSSNDSGLLIHSMTVTSDVERPTLNISGWVREDRDLRIENDTLIVVVDHIMGMIGARSFETVVSPDGVQHSVDSLSYSWNGHGSAPRK